VLRQRWLSQQLLSSIVLKHGSYTAYGSFCRAEAEVRICLLLVIQKTTVVDAMNIVRLGYWVRWADPLQAAIFMACEESHKESFVLIVSMVRGEETRSTHIISTQAQGTIAKESGGCFEAREVPQVNVLTLSGSLDKDHAAAANTYLLEPSSHLPCFLVAPVAQAMIDDETVD
jgi:hypothetical protein